MKAIFLLSPVMLLLLKWSLLLGVGWVGQALLRSQHPRARLVLWRIVLTASCLLPFWSWIPATSVQIPVAVEAEWGQLPVQFSKAEVMESASPAPAQQDTPKVAASIGIDRQDASAVPHARSDSMDGVRLLGWFWAAGVLLTAIKLLIAGVQLRRLRASATPGSSLQQAIVNEIAAEFRLRSRVGVFQGTGFRSPFVCGIIRPAVMLPRDLTLSENKLRALLRHELAHVCQRDVLWHLGWKMCCAVGWFHPLIWGVPKAHQTAFEEAADRMASGDGESRADYARLLAEMGLRAAGVPVKETGLALHATSQLAQRLQRLLHEPLGMWSWRRAFGMYLCVTVIAWIASSWSLVERSALGAPASARAGASGTRILRIVVQDEQGRPVEGATVEPYAYRVKGPKWVDHYTWDRATRPTLTTDIEGVAELPYPIVAMPKEKLLTGEISFMVKHPEYCPTTEHIAVDHPGPITMHRGLTLEVSGVFGPNSEPVMDLQLNLSGEPAVLWITNAVGHRICHQVSRGGHVLQAMGRLGSGQLVYSDGVDFTSEPGQNDDVLRGLDLTESQGKISARRNTANMTLSREGGDIRAAGPERGFHLTLVMRPGIRLEGRLDKAVLRPVKQGRVVISVRSKQFPAYLVPEEGGDLYWRYGRFQFWTSYRPIAEDGTFVFESIPPGEVDVLVHGEGFASRNGGKAHNRPVNSSPLVIGVPQAFELHEPVTQIQVETEATATIDVVVKTQKGEPVSGAQVSTWPNVMRLQTGIFGGVNHSSETSFREVESLSDMSEFYTGRTDSKGHVVLRNVPAVARVLDVEHPEFEVPLPEPKGQGMQDRSVRFRLEPGKLTALAIVVQRKGREFLGDAK